MLKKAILLLVLLFSFVPMAESSQLDIGHDINFEYRYIERADEVISSEFRQRIKFYLTGYLKDNIEIGARLHSYGIMDSTVTYVIEEGAKIQNHTPYFEKAYIKINNIYEYPLSISMGLLPLKWADGILINHNQTGLPAILLNANAPFGIDVETYYCRKRDDLLKISNIVGYGVKAVKEFDFRQIELNYTVEEYKSIAEVKRTIYGGRFTRKMKKGLHYSIFGYLMKGEKGGGEFKGHAVGAYGNFEGVVEPLGKGGAWIRYILGTGDPIDDESGFLPVLSSVESNMIGNFYGRYREFRMVDGFQSNTLTLSNSIANISIMRQSLYATIRDIVKVYMIRSTYKKHSPELPIGGSMTYGANYDYSFVHFNVAYTTFAPEDRYDFYEGKDYTRFVTIAVSARF